MLTLRQHLPEQNGCKGVYTDIYDGVVYQHLVSKGFLSHPAHITLMFNTEGVLVFRSSGFSFWPLYLLINELPYRMR